MFNPGFLYLGGVATLFIKDKRLREVVIGLITILSLIFIFSLELGQQQSLKVMNLDLIIFNVTAISKLIAIVFVVFGFAGVSYANVFVDNRYSFLALIYIGASVSILFTGDFISFYICWELMTISSFFLILFTAKTDKLRSIAYRYFIIQMVGAVSLLWGILLQYNATGSIALSTVEAGIPFFIVAVAIKLAFIAFHFWLPAIYANVPFYLSVLLSAYTTKVGVYALYRLLAKQNFLAYFGVITALGGVFLALRQTKARKLLSYHIISQIGYMITAITVGNKLGITGGILHLINNVLYKGLLFMVVGGIVYATGKEDLRELGGLAKKLPFLTAYGVIAALSITGVPFFSGHISKLLIKKSLTGFSFLSWGLYIAGIGTSISFIKLIYYSFFKVPDREVEIKRRPNKLMLLSMGLISLLLLVLAWQPILFTGMLKLEKDVAYWSLKYIWKSMQPVIIALLIFKFFSDLIEPKDHGSNNRDYYLVVTTSYNNLSEFLSKIHNGYLTRYLMWIITSFVFIVILLLI